MLIRPVKLREIGGVPAPEPRKWGNALPPAIPGMLQGNPQTKRPADLSTGLRNFLQSLGPYWAGVCEMSDTSIETPGPMVEEIAIFLT
jgi:hypothetical protein